MNSTVKTALLWVVIIVLVFLLWSLFQTTKGTSEKIPFSTFIDRVNANQVEKVTIRGDSIRGEFRATAPGGKREFDVTGPPGPYPAMYVTQPEPASTSAWSTMPGRIEPVTSASTPITTPAANARTPNLAPW